MYSFIHDVSYEGITIWIDMLTSQWAAVCLAPPTRSILAHIVKNWPLAWVLEYCKTRIVVGMRQNRGLWVISPDELHFLVEKRYTSVKAYIFTCVLWLRRTDSYSWLSFTVWLSVLSRVNLLNSHINDQRGRRLLQVSFTELKKKSSISPTDMKRQKDTSVGFVQENLTGYCFMV